MEGWFGLTLKPYIKEQVKSYCTTWVCYLSSITFKQSECMSGDNEVKSLLISEKVDVQIGLKDSNLHILEGL